MSKRECVECAAQTRTGARCKNITCLYGEFCAIHTKQLFDLELKQSNIKNAGKGLFTMKAIKKGANIAKYTGTMVSDEEFEANPSPYGLVVKKNRLIDAASTQTGLARYANSCKKGNNCKGNNSRFSISHRTNPPTVWLKATKNIKAGDEIFVPYGSKYW